MEEQYWDTEADTHANTQGLAELRRDAVYRQQFGCASLRSVLDTKLHSVALENAQKLRALVSWLAGLSGTGLHDPCSVMGAHPCPLTSCHLLHPQHRAEPHRNLRLSRLCLSHVRRQRGLLAQPALLLCTQAAVVHRYVVTTSIWLPPRAPHLVCRQLTSTALSRAPWSASALSAQRCQCRRPTASWARCSLT